MVYAAPVEFAKESGKCVMQGVMFEFPVIDGRFFGDQFYQGQVIQRQRQCFPAYKQGQLLVVLKKGGTDTVTAVNGFLFLKLDCKLFHISVDFLCGGVCLFPSGNVFPEPFLQRRSGSVKRTSSAVPATASSIKLLINSLRAGARNPMDKVMHGSSAIP